MSAPLQSPAGFPHQEIPHGPSATDQFESEIGAQSHPLYDKLVKYWPYIVGVVALIVVSAAGYGGYGAYQERRLANAEQALDQAVQAESAEQRLTNLESVQTSLPKPLMPRFHLETARAAQDMGDWSRALASWEKLSGNGLPVWEPVAGLGQATALLNLDRAGEALALLEALRDKATDEYQPLVLTRLAAAAEAAGDWEQALAAYEELKGLENSQQGEFLDFKASQIREQVAAQDEGA